MAIDRDEITQGDIQRGYLVGCSALFTGMAIGSIITMLLLKGC